MKKKQKEEKNNQLDLGLKSPLQNYFFELKRRFQNIFLYLEVVNFLKDPLNWLFITISICLVGMQAYFLYTTYDSLPSQIPIFTYFSGLQRKIAPQYYSLALPALSIILLVISARVSYRYFHRERVMSGILLFSSLLSILLITLLVLRVTVPFHG